MTKTMKFQPGTFIEIDDLAGGRKVVVVGRDGATYWDLLDAERVTPIVIHPTMNAIDLGSLVDFAEKVQLKEKLAVVATSLKAKEIDSEKDPLFVVRVLWAMSQNTDSNLVDEALLEHAIGVAQAQEATALKIHARAMAYCA